VIACIDRVNIGYAALTMNPDLGFDPRGFGLGADIFFAGYFLPVRLSATGGAGSPQVTIENSSFAISGAARGTGVTTYLDGGTAFISGSTRKSMPRPPGTRRS
jgi:hypothetical protein